MKCESCNTSDVEVTIQTDDENPPYFLCMMCHQRFKNSALRPMEYFNLAAIHGHDYYLHDDFYDDETGEAMQPREEVVDAGKFPFPELDLIKNDLHTLVDYAFVRYFCPEKIIEILKQHDNNSLLRLLIQKVEYNRSLRAKAYEIVAKIPSEDATDWILKEWTKRKPNEVLDFAEAIYSCLELEDAFNLLTTEVEASTTDKDLADNIGALLYFQDPRTLIWIETVANRIVNVATSWGVLAAASKFDWQTAEKWLSIGRPLSLIALDALHYCTTRGDRLNQALWLRKTSPVLENSPAVDVVLERLGAHLATDNSPRTRSMVEQVRKNLRHE